MWCLVPALTQHHPAAELLSDKIIDDMQAQSGAALVAARRKERVERLPLHVRRHSGPVVGKNDLDIVAAAGPRRNRDRPGTAVGEGMVGGVEEKIG